MEHDLPLHPALPQGKKKCMDEGCQHIISSQKEDNMERQLQQASDGSASLQAVYMILSA